MTMIVTLSPEEEYRFWKRQHKIIEDELLAIHWDHTHPGYAYLEIAELILRRHIMDSEERV